MLTDPEFLRRLDMLFLLTRKVLGGTLKADRRSKKKGSGINVADYAEYHYGDDYRHVDWNIYARLEELVIKLYELEEDVTVHVLLDLSHSMKEKALYAKKLAAALGYIALRSLDRLAIYGLADVLQPVFGPTHGKAKILTMLRELEAADLYGADTDFTECLRAFHLRRKRPGVCVIISDFFVARGYLDGLKLLQWAGNDVFCLQVVDPDELRCDWKGDLELRCVETGRRRKITIGPLEAARYAEAMASWNRDLKKECARREIGYVHTTTEIPFEVIIQNILREGGLVA